MNQHSTMVSRFGRRLAPLALVSAMGMISVLGGCLGAGNASWPPIDGQSALDDMNQPAVKNAIATALIWATRKYPPVANPEIGVEYTVPLAINLPPGTSSGTYYMVAKDIGMHAQPMPPEPGNLPVYHIGRVVIRGTDAIVDVLVPKYSIGVGTQGEQLYQGVTIDLRGGFRPWQVVAHRSFAVGSMSVPAANPVR